MIDPVTTQKIHDAAKIEDVVGDFISLKKRGVNMLGLCPFHNEKSPSFTVSPVKGIFKCFGCGESGNSVAFIMKHEKISYPEALKYIAKKYNIEIVEKERTSEEIQQQQEVESLCIVSEFAKKFFISALFNTNEGNAVGLSYFKERGFTEQTIKKFELGWSPTERDALLQAALKAGYKQTFLEKTGLVVFKEETNYRFDRFAGRVMFPIHALSGKVLGFGGRVLVTDKKIAKYINSPESEIYHKSNILYGIFHAKTSIVKQDRCIIVEGYTDVISMVQAGVENVVASSGTSLTQNQIRLVKRFTKNITIIYDGDSAGIKASLRGIDLVLAEEMIVKVVSLPETEDPDSFAKSHTTEELTEYIKANEIDFIKFKTNLLLQDAKNDPVRRAQLVNDVIVSISVIPNQILRSEYIKETATLLSVKEETLYSEIDRILNNKRQYSGTEDDRQKKEAKIITLPVVFKETYFEPYEKMILYFFLNFGKSPVFYDDKLGREQTVAEYIISELKNDNLEFRNLIYKNIFELYDNYISENGTLPEIEFFLNNPDEEVSKISSDIVAPGIELSKIWKKKGAVAEMPGDRLAVSVPEAIIRFKFKILELMIEDVDKEIMELKPDEYDKLSEILQRKMSFDSIKLQMRQETGDRVLL